MNTTLKNLLDFADKIGVVTQMLCYNDGFLTVEGNTMDGKKFEISLHIKEEEENA